MKKNLFSFILLFLAGLGTAQAYDFSAVAPSGQTLYYSYNNGSNGNSVSVTYPGNSNSHWDGHTKPSGILDIPDSVTYSGHTYLVTSIGPHAFFFCGGLTSISIGNSVTSIGAFAFSYCSRLISVTIPNSVTSIGGGAFQYSGLTSIIIPNSVTSIGDFAFCNEPSLASLIVASGNSVYDSRDNCNAIIETATNTLIVGCMNTTIPNSVTSIGNSAFAGCWGLTSISIPNSVSSIGILAFESCIGLTSVTIPNSVTSIGDNIFQSDTSLASVIVASGNSIYDSRDNCNAIIETATNTLIVGCKNTTIPNSVTSIGNRAFFGYSGLTSVTIPNSVTSIEDCAFEYCTGLIDVFSLRSVPSFLGNSAFYGIHSGATLHVPCGSRASYQASWGSYFTNIEETPYHLSVSSSDTIMGIAEVNVAPSCNNDTATITARHNCGYRFIHWSDGSNDNPRTLVVTQDTTLTAYFNFDVPDTVIIHDTLFVHDTTVTYLRDTLIVNYYQYDTTLVNIYDTTIVNVYDTVIYDTYQYDTTLVNVYDTVIRNIYQYDTTIYNNYTYDTSIYNHYRYDTTLVYDTMIVNVYTYDTSIYNNYRYDTIIINHYQYDTTIVYDTTIINTYQYDTTLVNIYDTTINNVYIYDTTIVNNFQYDTIIVNNYVYDTVVINNYTHDTVNNYYHDTINNYYYDTVIITHYYHDTVIINNYIYDTIYLYRYIFDTIYIHDTVLVYHRDTVIAGFDDGDPMLVNVKMYSNGHQIVVEGADEMPVRLYDSVGRLLATKQEHIGIVYLDVPVSGTYLVRIGNLPAKRVVVIR